MYVAAGFYFDWYKLCHIPHQGYKGHGSPERNDRITFTLETSNGELKKAWLPGETYTISTASGSGEDVQAFVHASIGTLSPVASPVSNTKFGFQANGCENAWGSEVSKKSHQMRWEAPAVVPKEGMCVVVSAAQASSQNAAFQTNSVRIMPYYSVLSMPSPLCIFVSRDAQFRYPITPW